MIDKIATVYHAKSPTFGYPSEGKAEPIFPQDYDHVADVKVEWFESVDLALEFCFAATNHIGWAWQDNVGDLVWYRSRTERSTSVGDIVYLDGEYYICDRIGWTKFDPFAFEDDNLKQSFEDRTYHKDEAKLEDYEPMICPWCGANVVGDILTGETTCLCGRVFPKSFKLVRKDEAPKGNVMATQDESVKIEDGNAVKVIDLSESYPDMFLEVKIVDEGVIYDLWKGDDCIATKGQTFVEIAEELLGDDEERYNEEIDDEDDDKLPF